MKYSVFTLAFPGYSVEEVISTSAAIGFDGIDIRVNQDGHIYIDASKERRRQILEYAKTYNIKLFGVYSYLGHNLISTSPSVANKELALLEAHLDLALDLEATYVRIFAGTRERTESNMMNFIKNCKKICPKAEDRGIYLCLETHGELAWDGDACNEIIEEVGSENLRVIFDPAIMYFSSNYTLDPVTEAEKIKAKILGVHFKDHVKSDEKPVIVPLGDGDVPIEDIINFLKRIVFDQYAIVEYEKWWQPDLPDPKVWLPRELSYLKRRF